MTQYSCKFCSNPCDLKKFQGMELAMCGQCFRDWKKAINHNR